MIRKRTIIIVITILLLLAGILFYLQWGRQMDVSSSSGSGSDNHYELRVSVILNTLVVTDQQKCAEQIFEKCRDNSFHSVRFSYDIQIPHALSVTVYKNQKDAESGNSAFSFSYRQENQIDGHTILWTIQKNLLWKWTDCTHKAGRTGGVRSESHRYGLALLVWR